MNAMNQHYEKAVAVTKQIEGKATGLWGHLCLFVGDVLATSTDTALDMKKIFKDAEKQATAEKKVDMGKNSTYRVQKGLLIKAVELGIPVCVDGKPVGKTHIEKLIKDEAVPAEKKPAYERFQSLANSISSVADELPEHDVILATGVLQQVMNKLTPRIKLAA